MEPSARRVRGSTSSRFEPTRHSFAEVPYGATYPRCQPLQLNCRQGCKRKMIALPASGSTTWTSSKTRQTNSRAQSLLNPTIRCPASLPSPHRKEAANQFKPEPETRNRVEPITSEGPPRPRRAFPRLPKDSFFEKISSYQIPLETQHLPSIRQISAKQPTSSLISLNKQAGIGESARRAFAGIRRSNRYGKSGKTESTLS